VRLYVRTGLFWDMMQNYDHISIIVINNLFYTLWKDRFAFSIGYLLAIGEQVATFPPRTLGFSF
jgi:hypothetical protein